MPVTETKDLTFWPVDISIHKVATAEISPQHQATALYGGAPLMNVKMFNPAMSESEAVFALLRTLKHVATQALEIAKKNALVSDSTKWEDL